MAPYGLGREKTLSIGLFLFFVVTMIGLASTTSATRLVIEPTRFLAAVLMVSLVLMAVHRNGQINKVQILSLMLYFGMVAYGLLLSYILGGARHVTDSLAADFLLTVTLIAILSSRNKEIVGSDVAKMYFWFAVVSVVATGLLGGIILRIPPEFVLEYYSIQVGAKYDQTYSQGISRFYGLAAVVSAFLCYSSHSAPKKILFFVATVSFIFLSVLGGARGDSAASVAVVAMMFARHRILALLSLALAASIAIALMLQQGWFQELVIFERMMRLRGSFGMRDVLWMEALELLLQDPTCMFIGCGFGYFQFYQGYDSGFHPHNVLIEMMISIGLPVTLFFSLAWLRGFFSYARASRYQSDAFPWIFLFFFIIFMKSDTLLSAWLFIGSTCFFAARAFAMTKVSRIVRALPIHRAGRDASTNQG